MIFTSYQNLDQKSVKTKNINLISNFVLQTWVGTNLIIPYQCLYNEIAYNKDESVGV